MNGTDPRWAMEEIAKGRKDDGSSTDPVVTTEPTEPTEPAKPAEPSAIDKLVDDAKKILEGGIETISDGWAAFEKIREVIGDLEKIGEAGADALSTVKKAITDFV